MARLPVSAGAIRKLLKEVEGSAGGEHVLAVGGAEELAAVLRRQFLRGGADPDALRLGGPDRADAYLHVLAAAPSAEDEATLKHAHRERVPTIAIAAAPFAEDVEIPYVLATDVVRVEAGRSFPLEQIARALAARLDEDGAPLAARIPLLRVPVCDRLVSSFARKNALVAAAVWIPGADLPVLTLNEIRLLLRLEQAYGVDGSANRHLPEIVSSLGAGLGLRALAREALDLVPVAGWAVKGAVAYAGTRAFGEAALRLLEREAAATPRPAATSPDAP